MRLSCRVQGIPWSRLNYTRAAYRKQRTYQNYMNEVDMNAYSSLQEFHSKGEPRGVVRQAQSVAPCLHARPPSPLLADADRARAAELGSQTTATCERKDLFAFYRNFRDVQSTIIHFQLRNLVWATSAHDVYVVHANCVKHWNMVSRRMRTVLDLTGGAESVAGASMSAGVVHVSTCCVGGGVVAAGTLRCSGTHAQWPRPDATGMQAASAGSSWLRLSAGAAR